MKTTTISCMKSTMISTTMIFKVAAMFKSLPSLNGNFYTLARMAPRNKVFAEQAVDLLKDSLDKGMRLFVIETDDDEVEVRLTVDKRRPPGTDKLTYIAASVSAFIRGAIRGKLFGGIQERMLLTTGIKREIQSHAIVMKCDGQNVNVTADGKPLAVKFQDIMQAESYLTSRSASDWAMKKSETE